MAHLQIAVSQSYLQWPVAWNRARGIDRGAQYPALLRPGFVACDSLSRIGRRPPKRRQLQTSVQLIRTVSLAQAGGKSPVLSIRPCAPHVGSILVYHSGGAARHQGLRTQRGSHGRMGALALAPHHSAWAAWRKDLEREPEHPYDHGTRVASGDLGAEQPRQNDKPEYSQHGERKVELKGRGSYHLLEPGKQSE